MSPRNRFVANELRRAGFATLLRDLLTEEEDAQGAQRFDIELLTRRLHAAVNWLREEPEATGLPIALFGASTGAAAALSLPSLETRSPRWSRAERVAALASDWLIRHVRAEPRVAAVDPTTKGAPS